ncbi:MAG: hypothetical protein LBJ00_04405 [Planctomycetaceae bacterium]|nr:hypothetical protein [Planctomycetaceae bacterium]
MKKLFTLVFVAAVAFVSSNVFAQDAAAAAETTTSEAPIVVGPYWHGFGHNHGGLYGDQFVGEYGVPGQKPSLLARIGNRLKSAKAARDARRATSAYGNGFEGVPTPKRKLFTPRNRAGFGGGFNGGFHGGFGNGAYQEFPAEFQVGGYY